MDSDDLQDTAKAFSSVTAALHQAQDLAAADQCAWRFDTVLADAQRHLDLLDSRALQLDAPQPRNTVAAMSPILHARLDWMRQRAESARSMHEQRHRAVRDASLAIKDARSRAEASLQAVYARRCDETRQKLIEALAAEIAAVEAYIVAIRAIAEDPDALAQKLRAHLVTAEPRELAASPSSR